jgi:hypothetical protein
MQLKLCGIILVMEMTMKMMSRSYSELITIPTFEERYKYLKLDGVVGKETFGFNRYLNQVFYLSPEWRSTRRNIILRDEGNDLACDGFEIHGNIMIHHINPITYDDIYKRNPIIFDPNNLITTRLKTHNAIHYGDEKQLNNAPIERTKNDTCPWR